MPDSICGDAKGHPRGALWSFDLGGGMVPWVGSAPPDVRSLRTARKISSRSGAGHVPTYAYSTTVDGHVRLESGLEHDLLRDLDRDPDVSWLVPQPGRVRALSANRPGTTPDLLSQTVDGSVTVWAVRPEPKQDEKFWTQVRQAEEACAEFGWSHCVFSGMSPTRRSNLMWLDGYRTSMPWHAAALQKLVSEAGREFSMLVVLEADQGAGHVLSAVWNAIRRGDIVCDLDLPFTSRTALHLREGAVAP